MVNFIEPSANATHEPSAAVVAPAGHLLVAADLLTLAYELSLYAAAFAGPVLLLAHLRMAHPLLLLGLAIAGWLAAAMVFLGLLVATKRILVGRVPNGRFFVTGMRARRWIAADRLMKIAWRSPFRALFTECALFRHPFYRGMGARIHACLMLGSGVKLPEPWALRIGRGVLIGDEAVISGHKVERGVVTLAEVEIGDHALIGARTIVLPGARIGARAVIGAQSLVTQGMVVPAGETWAGNPARRLGPFALLAQMSPSGAER